MNGMFYALIAFCVVDWITGMIRYCTVEKSLTSATAFRRAFEKLLIFVMIGVANIIDTSLLSQGEMLRDAVIFFYLSAEGIKILEHMSALGLPIPKKLRAILKDPDLMDDIHQDEKK